MSKKRRVRFAPGPLFDQYHTKDGHPQHEGQTAKQKRVVQSPWPVDLTAHNIKMLEGEIGEICQQSIQRLKRRVGLLPPLQRELHYLTITSPSSEASTDKCLQQPLYGKQRLSKQPNQQNSTARVRKASRITAPLSERISHAACQASLEAAAQQVADVPSESNVCDQQAAATVQVTKVYSRAKRRQAQPAEDDAETYLHLMSRDSRHAQQDQQAVSSPSSTVSYLDVA